MEQGFWQRFGENAAQGSTRRFAAKSTGQLAFVTIAMLIMVSDYSSAAGRIAVFVAWLIVVALLAAQAFARYRYDGAPPAAGPEA